MGLFSWISRLGRRGAPRASEEPDQGRADAGTVSDAGEAQVGQFRFTATLTTMTAEQLERSEDRGRFARPEERGTGWDRVTVNRCPKLLVHYLQKYRGRDEYRTVVYELELHFVDRGAFGAYRLIGAAKTGGKSYSEKTLPGNRIELVADDNGEVIEDIHEWLARTNLPTAEELAFQAADGQVLTFDPALPAVIEWQGVAANYADRYRVEIRQASWPSFHRGPRLEAYARRIPREAGQRAWAGRKVFYADEIVRLSEAADDEAISDIWGWLLARTN